ncbi:phospholipid scramblase 4 isoform X1 [Felis catus]|uniref:Phospholipid scramblase n=1 Tax=Felis catus TaxID=9685 RepID=A0ABI7YT51_FELCA|nr:phospholipid scramblase 4 isoform X1 [Felis catus]XP_044893406.1 phospholipid scramblase 4 isoform X1 [Felis catus]XP_044893407.1 phospholipid scramblase 4 isoform X1 [Felis catus]XP_044893408.1 phospholipid scramblase 4 isoform X1 [Felis catus]XP_044893409.1 phospholipid scramblase 4 isoform X1 [Felis catus]XP_044893410.1 phospholipid scramblase 4 isoform X1 [Felis catus]
MSGVIPTAPEQPADEKDNQIKSPDQRPDAPPDYNSHFVPVMSTPNVGLKLTTPKSRVLCCTDRTIQVLPQAFWMTTYYDPQTPWTGCPCTCRLRRRLAYGIQQSAAARYLLLIPASWWCPSYPVPAWQIPYVKSACFSNMDARASSYTKLSSWSGILNPVITSFETNNGYDIKNNLDQMVYIVNEDTDDFTRNAYRTLRPFVLRVTDCMGREIMTMQRPFRCTCCCFCCPSTRQELEVQCPPGVTIGFVAEHWNLCRAVYSIQNEKKENVMRVRGPCSTYGCGSDSVFEVKSLDGVSNIGSIIRKWNGLLSAMGDADQFEIHFPLDMDVKMKAMIFGACFLIDFMYFERSPRRSSR